MKAFDLKNFSKKTYIPYWKENLLREDFFWQAREPGWVQEGGYVPCYFLSPSQLSYFPDISSEIVNF